MEPDFRQPDSRERALLDKLLEADFLGRDELRGQLSSLTVKQIEPDGTLRLRCHSGPPYPGEHRVVREGVCKDSDGAVIAILLHVGRDRLLCMLEIIRYDGAAIIQPPSAENLTVLV